jgi:hypothetical protein
LDLGEAVVTDDLDAQERDSRRCFFQIELLAQRAQILALFPRLIGPVQPNFVFQVKTYRWSREPPEPPSA